MAVVRGGDRCSDMTDVKLSQSEIPHTSRFRKYPNPFNPSTAISFDLPFTIFCFVESF